MNCLRRIDEVRNELFGWHYDKCDEEGCIDFVVTFTFNNSYIMHNAFRSCRRTDSLTNCSLSKYLPVNQEMSNKSVLFV